MVQKIQTRDGADNLVYRGRIPILIASSPDWAVLYSFAIDARTKPFGGRVLPHPKARDDYNGDLRPPSIPPLPGSLRGNIEMAPRANIGRAWPHWHIPPKLGLLLSPFGPHSFAPDTIVSCLFLRGIPSQAVISFRAHNSGPSIHYLTTPIHWKDDGAS